MKYNNGDSFVQSWFAKNIWQKNNGRTPPHALEKSSKTFLSPNNLKSPKHVMFLLMNSLSSVEELYSLFGSTPKGFLQNQTKNAPQLQLLPIKNQEQTKTKQT